MWDRRMDADFPRGWAELRAIYSVNLSNNSIDHCVCSFCRSFSRCRYRFAPLADLVSQPLFRDDAPPAFASPLHVGPRSGRPSVVVMMLSARAREAQRSVET